MADEQTSEEQGQQIPRDQQQAYYDFANNAENPIGERMTASLGLVAQLVEDRARAEHAISHLAARLESFEALQFAALREILRQLPGDDADKVKVVDIIRETAETFAHTAHSQAVQVWPWVAGGELEIQTEEQMREHVEERMAAAKEAGDLEKGECLSPSGECSDPLKCTNAQRCMGANN